MSNKNTYYLGNTASNRLFGPLSDNMIPHTIYLWGTTD